jgi:hypothetical protein
VNRVILKQPVAVFDAGIGSYAIARKIADRFSGQDVLYFTDRANFPYGASDLVELVENGAFLTDVDGTLAAVRANLATLHRDTDIATLSHAWHAAVCALASSRHGKPRQTRVPFRNSDAGALRRPV